jgi:hypothetical protein
MMERKMTIRTEINREWREVLEMLPEGEPRLLIEEADRLAMAVAYRNHMARMSMNGALEVLFALGCWMNRLNGDGRKGKCNG